MNDKNSLATSLERVPMCVDSLVAAVDRLTAQIEHIDSARSELLSEAELVALTGFRLPSRRITWLKKNGWQYVLTGANHPVIGRVYARLKLAGIKPTATDAVTEAWTLDLSRVG